LQGSVGLSWAAESGASAPVSVATRTTASKVEKATVSSAGVEAPSELPLKAGETVRLAWGSFQYWGLVVRGAPSAQIRFAGLAPEEEAQIRDWLEQPAATLPATQAPAAGPPPAASMPAEAVAAKPPEAAAGKLSEAAAAKSPEAAATKAPEAAAAKPPEAAGGRAAPASGPPPGFADRKPIRPQTKSAVRVPPPVMSGGAPATPAVAPAARTPKAAPTPKTAPTPPATPRAAAAAPAAPPGAVPDANGGAGPSAISGLFEEGAAPAAAQAAPAPTGPTWPVPTTPLAVKVAAAQILRDKSVPPETPPGVAASVKKVAGMLGSVERAALEKAGFDSHLADAIASRIALDAATAEGVRLYSSNPAAVVDAGAVAAMIKQADEAAARLQKEANAAIGKGQVESLQLLTAASASLSRDLFAFKETADRLRGIAAAPRLGAGALDPDVVLPGQAPRPKPLPSVTVQTPPKAELRDFRGLDAKPGRSKNVIMVLLVAGAVAAAANGFYFSLPHHIEIPAASAGEGIHHIDMIDETAMVTVTSDWVAHVDARLPQLDGVLRERGVKKAILILPTGSTLGILDVTSGKLSGRALGK